MDQASTFRNRGKAMSYGTLTYTKTDVRRAFENFQADLQMLAVRTQAMEFEHAVNNGYDVALMSQENCLESVHIQLRDSRGKLVKAHRYSIEEGIVSDTARPGGNRWPCLPDGTLHVIVKPSDGQKLDQLERAGKLITNWSPSTLSTNYAGMRGDGTRLYSSNSYGLRRDTFAS